MVEGGGTDFHTAISWEHLPLRIFPPFPPLEAANPDELAFELLIALVFIDLRSYSSTTCGKLSPDCVDVPFMQLTISTLPHARSLQDIGSNKSNLAFFTSGIPRHLAHFFHRIVLTISARALDVGACTAHSDN